MYQPDGEKLLGIAAEPGRSPRSWVDAALLEESRVWLVLILTGVPASLAALLLLAPPAVFSREMSWDFLFDLEGAWHIWNGQIPHVSFHTPIGAAGFALTALGFAIAGVGPHAFLVGTTLYAALILAAALAVLPQRLPPLAAAVAGLYLVLLVLMPSNLGDSIEAYSFAMSYNRFGWSALTLLFLLLFLSPQQPRRAALDQAIAFLVTTWLFYLKITYFGVALAALVAAMLLVPAVRRERKGWTVVLAALALLAAAPFNRPYWQDILAAIGTGAVRADLLDRIKAVLNYGNETTVVIAQFACLVALRRSGVTWERLISALFIMLCGLFVLSQNAQAGGVPLYIVVAFLLFDSLRESAGRAAFWHGIDARLLLTTVLVAPVVVIVATMVSLVGYYGKAVSPEAASLVDETNLAGLAVPTNERDLLDLFAGGVASPDMLNAARLEHARYELSQDEYIETLRDAAALLRPLIRAQPQGRDPQVMLFDQVNPLPFMLGLAPPRGGALWLDRVFPWPSPAQALAAIDYVLVPKFSTSSAVTGIARQRYGAYLRANFDEIRDTPRWLVFARLPANGSEALSGAAASR